MMSMCCSFYSGENVEEAFLNTARKIFAAVKDGTLDPSSAETGVQSKSPASLPKQQQRSGGCC